MRARLPSPDVTPLCWLTLLLACVGGPPTPDAGGSGLPGLSVGGVYPTRVTLTGSTCGAVEVQDAVTEVAQAPGAAALSLTHAGNRYAGTVDRTGAFSTAPRTLVAGESRFTVSLSGHFSRTGFEADVHVEVVQPTPPEACGYDVHWVGTKQGPENTLP